MRISFLFLFLAARLCCLAQDSTSLQKQLNTASIIKATALPVALIGYGIICVNDRGFPSSRDVKKWRDDRFSSFKNHTDDYLLYANGLFMYGFDLLHVKSKSDVWNQSIILAKTTLVTLGATGAIKYTFKTRRPDGSDNLSFPSGHTALAFAYATVLHKEFKDASPWISILGYTTAIATGSMRVLNNKHWFSDVVAGAGVGILSANLVYLTHRYKFRNGKLKNSSYLPIIGNNYYGLLWQKTF